MHIKINKRVGAWLYRTRLSVCPEQQCVGPCALSALLPCPQPSNTVPTPCPHLAHTTPTARFSQVLNAAWRLVLVQDVTQQPRTQLDNLSSVQHLTKCTQGTEASVAKDEAKLLCVCAA